MRIYRALLQICMALFCGYTGLFALMCGSFVDVYGFFAEMQGSCDPHPHTHKTTAGARRKQKVPIYADTQGSFADMYGSFLQLYRALLRICMVLLRMYRAGLIHTRTRTKQQ